MCSKDHLTQDMLCGEKKKIKRFGKMNFSILRPPQLPNPMDTHNLLAHERL